MGFKEELINFPHAQVSFEQPMKKHTALCVGGNALYYARVDNLFALKLLVELAKSYKVPFKVIGNGTNLLVSDSGYNGLIINLSGLNDVFFKRDNVRAMAGASIEKLIKFALSHRLAGLEALSGIPATVGGAVVMNAGAFGHNISDLIVSVETLSQGKLKIYDKDQCKFAYRTSRFVSGRDIIVSATFDLKEDSRETILAAVKNFSELRKKSQPIGRSCGSVFKNPKKASAGELIDLAGLKGYRIGGACVSNVHANFIITETGATASDVYALINYLKDKIKRQFNVELVNEVELVGEF